MMTLIKTPVPAAGQNRFLSYPKSMLERFVHNETSGSALLLGATVVALIWANSPWSASYFALWKFPLKIGILFFSTAFSPLTASPQTTKSVPVLRKALMASRTLLSSSAMSTRFGIWTLPQYPTGARALPRIFLSDPHKARQPRSWWDERLYRERNMTGGFAILAYPAEYRNSGVMSFLINQDGVVIQKDLGKNTVAVAKTITELNPDDTWQLVE